MTLTITVPKAHGLMSASVIGGNYDADYIYYAINNNIWLTDVATLQEALQVTLPVGETVTCIQHIKYPQPSAGIPNTTDFLAIATYANGHYKVWLYKISSTGTIAALPQPNFEGGGRVTNVTYVEQGMGSRVYHRTGRKIERQSLCGSTWPYAFYHGLRTFQLCSAA